MMGWRLHSINALHPSHF